MFGVTSEVLTPLCILLAKEEKLGPRGIGRGQRFLISQAAAQRRLLETAGFGIGWCQARFDLVPLDIASDNEPYLSNGDFIFPLEILFEL